MPWLVLSVLVAFGAARFAVGQFIPPPEGRTSPGGDARKPADEALRKQPLLKPDVPQSKPGVTRIPAHKIRVYVKAIRFDGLSGKGLSAGELSNTLVELAPVPEGYTVSREGLISTWVRIGDIGSPEGRGRLVDGGALSAVLRAISAAYSDAGIGAVRATIMRKTVDGLLAADSDGVLSITIIEGRVGSVHTAVRRVGNEMRKDADGDARIKYFSPVQAGDLVRVGELDAYVYRLGRYPWRRVDVAIAPGTEPGEVSLEYVVSEVKPYTLYAQISNTGTEATGNWRERVGFYHYDFTGVDDILSLEYVTSFRTHVDGVTASYERPLPYLPRVRVRVYGSWDEYRARNVGVLESDFEGESYAVGVEGIWNFFQYKSLFVDAVSGIQRRYVRVDDLLLNTSGRSAFVLPYAGLRAERHTDGSDTLASVFVEWNLPGCGGTKTEKVAELGRADAHKSWHVARYNMSHSFYVEPLVCKDWDVRKAAAHEVYFALNGQWIFEQRRVPPSFMRAIGGYHSVRGYPESFVAGDNAIVGNLEYRLHLPRLLPPKDEGLDLLGKTFRLLPQRKGARPDWDLILRLFFDVGRVTNNARLAFENDLTLVSAGAGFELAVLRNLNFRMDYGVALRPATNGQEHARFGSSRLHFVLTLLF